jgi:hypothetical protein
MLSPHVLDCPTCKIPATRIYCTPTDTYPGSLFNKDGSRMDEGDIPRVHTGHNKFFSGFGGGK